MISISLNYVVHNILKLVCKTTYTNTYFAMGHSTGV
jgi:hypothetical protein